MNAVPIMTPAERCIQAEHRVRFLEALLNRLATDSDTLKNFVHFIAQQAEVPDDFSYVLWAIGNMAERLGAIAELGGPRDVMGAVIGQLLSPHEVGLGRAAAGMDDSLPRRERGAA